MNLRFNKKVVLLLAAAFNSATAVYDPKVHMAESSVAIPNKFIVVLKTPPSGERRSRALAEQTAEDFTQKVPGAKVKEVYHAALEGFVVEMTEEGAHEMAKSDEVDYIEQDSIVHASQVTWGIDRVDQRDLPLNGQYNVGNDGTGVYAYILDTGVQISHDEFGGRATWGANTSGDGDDRDCNGHGTHVAGTVGGSVYGVAKNVNIVAVKVLTCSGSGSTSGVIAGVDWVRNDAIEKKATANMSLGGGFSSALNNAVKNLHNSGVPTVVAAGNDNGDACTKSPASEEAVITVGSTTSSDARSSFSNFGSCLDIFAPGSGITAAWIGSNSAINTISGTSMASPHVCGGAALLLEAGVPAADIDTELISRATDGTVSDPRSGSPNKLLFVGPVGPTPSPTPAPPTPAPTPCTGSTFKVEITTDNYPAETTWTLKNDCSTSDENVMSGGPFTDRNTMYEEEACLEPAEYTFTILDSYGDGLCCTFGSGSYKITYDGTMIKEGSTFGDEESTTFGECSTSPPVLTPSEPPTKAPTKAPTQSPTSLPPTKAPTQSPTSLPPTKAPTQPPTSLPPTKAPTQSPTNPPTTLSPTAECGPDNEKLEVSVTTDNYPQETSWEVKVGCTDEVVLKGGPYANANNEYVKSLCVPLGGSYTFTIFDTHGDGNCCGYGNGSYSVKLGDDTIGETAPRFKYEKSLQLGTPSENTFELNLKTDSSPRETSWQIFNRCTGTTELSASTGDYRDADTDYTVIQCVPDGAYTFTIYDSAGNGLGTSGSYSVKYGGNTISNTALTGASVSTDWGTSCGTVVETVSKPKPKEPLRKLKINDAKK